MFVFLRPLISLEPKARSDASYFGFTVGSPPGVPGGGITGVEAVPLSGGGRTLRSPICGGFITPLDWQLGSAEFEPVFGRVAGGSQGFGAGSACGVSGSCGDATAARLPAAMSTAAKSPNPFIFMALASYARCLSSKKTAS